MIISFVSQGKVNKYPFQRGVVYKITSKLDLYVHFEYQLVCWWLKRHDMATGEIKSGVHPTRLWKGHYIREEL